MVVDTSAVLAIFFGEPEAPLFAVWLERSSTSFISAASMLECAIVLRARKRIDPVDLDRRLDDFAGASGLAIEPVTLGQLAIARRADQLFGRGTGHPARLNFGDCFAYALAKERALPLLFKGDDFVHRPGSVVPYS